MFCIPTMDVGKLMIVLTNNQIEIYSSTEEDANEVREKLMDTDLLGSGIFIRPAVANRTDAKTHKWVCRGWISNDSGGKGGFKPEAIHAVLSQHLSS